jgi:hypothetical protein
VISGSPATTLSVGSAYNFQPTATDADGDPLSFSISGKPAWASFSSNTGRLSGTPAASGSYDSIVISVSDGTETASLAAFSITVKAVQEDPAGSFTLSWSAPTTRADGSPLSLADIDGYRIYYSNSPGNYSSVVEVPDGTAQSADVTDLPAGTYYLVMTTYDNTGQESTFSEEIAKTTQ